MILKPTHVHFPGNRVPRFPMCLQSGRWVIVGPNHMFLKKKIAHAMSLLHSLQKTHRHV